MIPDEFLYKNLDTAARLVANPDADQRNAWDVLCDRVGPTVAMTLVRSTPGGTTALARLGFIRNEIVGWAEIPDGSQHLTVEFTDGTHATYVRKDTTS